MNSINPIINESPSVASGGIDRRKSAEDGLKAGPPPSAADSFTGSGPRAFRKLDLRGAADAVSHASKMPGPEVLWEFDAGHAIQSKPLINRDGSIIVGCRSGEVCAFDPNTGAKRWTFQTEDAQYSAIVSGPPGTVYIPGNGKDRKLHAVDDKTGQQIWEYDLKGEPSTTATLSPDGTIFIGSSIFKPVSRIAAACNEGAVYAIDGKTGKRKWRFKTGNLVVSTPTPGPQGSIYFGGYDSTFYSIDEKTGKKNWEFKTDGWISSSPTFSADGKVYFGSWDKKIYALDGKTGSKVWDFATMGDVRGGICQGPDGTLYAGSFDGNLYALDGSTGALKWKRDTGGKVISAPIMDDKGTLYVGNFKGTLSAYDSASGEKKWEFRAQGDIEGSPSVRPDGIVYFGTKGGKLYALDSNKLSTIIDELHLDDEGSGKGHDGAQVEIIDDFLVIDGIKLPLGKNVQETPAVKEPPPPEPPAPQAKAPQKELTMLFYMNGQYEDIGDNVADALMKLEKREATRIFP
jgi:eukaryotic-like serine/threonine-protein kinase